MEGTENSNIQSDTSLTQADSTATSVSAVALPESGSAESAQAGNSGNGSESPEPEPDALPAVLPSTTSVTAVPPVTGAVATSGLLADVKSLLQAAGHDVEAVWDDAVAFARKAAGEEAELADKLVSVLRVAGHDVAEIIGDAFSFARKHGKS